jgi:BirA family biotin operon repressor/biotin-[acetyl-CoA-carboxylase] ligase
MNHIHDTLFPENFPGREEKIRYFEEVSSTMDIARDLARNGCPHFTVVIADHQVKGRGRLKRAWISSQGGLYFTLILRPRLTPLQSYKINFLASLVLAKVLKQNYNINAGVKWPNDVLVEGKKISGILSEMETQGDRIEFINVGIGVNVNNDPANVEPKATSVQSILNRNVSRKDLLSDFLDEFEARLMTLAADDVVSQWKQHTVTLNQKVRIVTLHEVSEGIAVDVDQNGALLLSLSDGSIKTILYGDCFPV